MPRRYNKVQKAEAVAAATMTSAEAAAEVTGIPRSTIRYWLADPEFAELRLKTREEVADRMWAAIQAGVEEVAKGLMGDAPLRDKATAVGILYDKHALLTGSATSRTESRELNDLPDSAYIDAVREARHLTEDGGAAPDLEPAEASEG